jgi:LysM repeat protein
MTRKLFLLICLAALPLLACNLTAVTPTSTPPANIIAIPTAVSTQASALATATEAVTTTTIVAPTTTTPAATAVATQPTTATCTIRSEWPTYVVQPGDTVFKISQLVGSTVDELATANCLTDARRIDVGQVLHVPVTIVPTATAVADDTTVYALSACYDSPFFPDLGVTIGERWRTLDYAAPPLYASETAATPFEQMGQAEVFCLEKGPICFTRTVNGRSLAFRRWQISSESRSLIGWLDEYDAQAEVQQIRSAPKIIRFDVSPATINSGDTVTLQWEVEGASEVYLHAYHHLHRFGSTPLNDGNPLPASGTFTDIPPLPLNQIQYSIGFTSDPDEMVTVPIKCRHTFFVETDIPACPLAPMVPKQAVYQPFERGFMVWQPGKIWVFSNDTPSNNELVDTWNGEPITFDEEPPDGLFLPQRGFGKVWVEKDWIQHDLGWATAVEQSYSMEFQETQTGFGVFRYFVSLPDGRYLHVTLFHGTSLSWQLTSKR